MCVRVCEDCSWVCVRECVCCSHTLTATLRPSVANNRKLKMAARRVNGACALNTTHTNTHSQKINKIMTYTLVSEPSSKIIVSY